MLNNTLAKVFIFSLFSLTLSSCSTMNTEYPQHSMEASAVPNETHDMDYASRLPQQEPGGKMILVDPNVHAWGAYDSSGSLVRAGIATAGSDWCPDIDRPCRTKS